MALREVRLHFEGPVQQRYGLFDAIALLCAEVIARLQVELVHLLALRRTLDDRAGMWRQQLLSQPVDDRTRDVLLDLEDIPEFPVVVL